MPTQPSLRDKAQRLAKAPYAIEVSRDETTDGEPIFLARVLELSGCMGQGNTPEEAVRDLEAAKVDYIESLLEDGLPVPHPAAQATVSVSTATTVVFPNPIPPDPASSQNENPARLYEASLTKL